MRPDPRLRNAFGPSSRDGDVLGRGVLWDSVSCRGTCIWPPDSLTPPFVGQLRPFLKEKICLLISRQHPFTHIRRGVTGAPFPSLQWTSEKALTQRTQTQLAFLGSSHLCFPADWQAILFLLLVSSLNNENEELQCDNNHQRFRTWYTITTGINQGWPHVSDTQSFHVHSPAWLSKPLWDWHYYSHLTDG